MDATLTCRLLSNRLALSRMQLSPAQYQARSRQSIRPHTPRLRTQRQQPTYRHASSSSSSSNSNIQRPGKPIVLEKPDKFRPPSHPQRLNARRTTAPLMGGYNQGTSQTEREAQKTRKYPHMFPQEGTVMYRFLTNKLIHVWISLGILTSLAIFTLITSFTKTSPFAHLLPPLSSLPFHPITYIKEYASIVRMHIDYTTEQTARKRQQHILDAQKRRLYRRAHGMEDLDAKEDTGVDVRGLVEWDDGLTNRERARGGRKVGVMTGQQILDVGGMAALQEAQRRKEEVDRGVRASVGSLEDIVAAAAAGGNGGDDGGEEGRMDQELPKRRKVKRWFGIWE